MKRLWPPSPPIWIPSLKAGALPLPSPFLPFLSLHSASRRWRGCYCSVPSPVFSHFDYGHPSKSSFYGAVKEGDVPGSLASYGEARARGVVNKHMTSALISLCSHNAVHRPVVRLWDAHAANKGPTPLNPFLCCDFIKAFTRLQDLDRAKRVLHTARASRLANTEVYNSFLSACAKLQDISQTVESLETISSQMEEDGVSADVVTCSVLVRIYGDAGDLASARECITRSNAWGDIVVLNTFLRAAAAAGDTQLAFSTLHQMEEEGPPPDLVSYNTVLHAVRIPLDQTISSIAVPCLSPLCCSLVSLVLCPLDLISLGSSLISLSIILLFHFPHS